MHVRACMRASSLSLLPDGGGVAGSGVASSREMLLLVLCTGGWGLRGGKERGGGCACVRACVCVCVRACVVAAAYGGRACVGGAHSRQWLLMLPS